MPIFFLVVGVMLVIVAINNKMRDLADLVKDDFTPKNGEQGFATWIVAIFVAGSLGYVKDLKPVANAFLVLIVIGMLLSNKGFFAKFNEALKVG